LADLNVAYATAHCGDLPSELVPDDQRKPWDGELSRDDPEVGSTDPAVVHLEEDLATPRRRPRNLSNAQRPGAVEHQGRH
jgi:hypothetical protein